MGVTQPTTIAVENVLIAHHFLKDVVVHTPLQLNEYLSEKYGAKIYFKREDLQHVRSFKLRGAYYKIKKSKRKPVLGVVCASAGNHAQGVAYACAKLEIKATIFMPKTTPKQKIDQVRMFGRSFVEIVLAGDTFDDSAESALTYCEQENRIFIHPFDDADVMVAKEQWLSKL